MRVSGDGQRVGVIGGVAGISLSDVNSRTGALRQVSAFPASNGAYRNVYSSFYPGDLAFHPVLGLGVAEENQQTQTVLHLFSWKALEEKTTFTLSANRTSNDLNPASGLLTFGARGTKLLYYDRRTGYLRSMPLTLTDKDKEALAKAYSLPGK